MRATKLCVMLLSLTVISALPALAYTCSTFASSTCAKSTPDYVHFVGTGSAGQSVGTLLGSNTFTVDLVHSEAGILGGESSVTPEPASLTLLGTGLACIAGLVRYKVAKRERS
jgi:hypothetical protein